MTLTHKIDHFLSQLFPTINVESEDSILDTMSKFYAFGPYKPKVHIKNKIVYVEIDVPTIKAEHKDYQHVVNLCNQGNYAQAKQQLLKLIDKNPTNSEYHRIMGQILSDEGDNEEAINYLIDALRWDSKNSYALLMMGNIYAKQNNDIQTALIYYNQALENNPNDHITLVNIGVSIFQSGNTAEGLNFINKAITAKPDFPNAYMALVKIAEVEQNWLDAFNHAIKTLKLCQEKDIIYKNALKSLVDSANKLIANTAFSKTLSNYKGKLEAACDKNIDIIENNDIPTPAKIQIAENYGREKHLVYFKPDYTAYEHLLMHELVHLDLITQARNNGVNKLFTTNNQLKDNFSKKYKNTLAKNLPKNIDNNTLDGILHNLLDGMNSRIYNAPIDLFIEEFLFTQFPDLRPFQLISQMQLMEEGIKAVTDKEILKMLPTDIIAATKIYNIVSAMQFKDMFGIDIIDNHNPTFTEKKTAQELYEEYLEYKADKEPGEEYELVQHWAEDLKMESYFILQDEVQEEKQENIFDFLDKIEQDPFSEEDYTPSEKRQMNKFLKENSTEKVNHAIAMYMIDGLKFFNKKDKAEIKQIAFDIARLGMFGIDPKKNNYKVDTIPNKTFSGNHLLAYYYTSWALAMPEVLHEVQLPFDKEFELAKQMSK